MGSVLVMYNLSWPAEDDEVRDSRVVLQSDLRFNLPTSLSDLFYLGARDCFGTVSKIIAASHCGVSARRREHVSSRSRRAAHHAADCCWPNCDHQRRRQLLVQHVMERAATGACFACSSSAAWLLPFCFPPGRFLCKSAQMSGWAHAPTFVPSQIRFETGTGAANQTLVTYTQVELMERGRISAFGKGVELPTAFRFTTEWSSVTQVRAVASIATALPSLIQQRVCCMRRSCRSILGCACQLAFSHQAA